MSRDDDDDYDDEPRPRRRPRQEDDDDLDDLPRRPRRSGTVTAVAIVAIILGSLALVCGVCVGIFGIIFESFRGAVEQELVNQAPRDANMAKAARDLARIPSWWIVAGGLLDAIRGFGLLFGGIGTLKRANWGRQLTLIMALLGIVIALLGLVMNVVVLGFDEPAQLVSGIFPVLVQIAFAVFAFVVLMNADNIREFER
jgi:hypothetical protein